MYAIVEISGKQYKVSEGDIVFIARMESFEAGSAVEFDKVLFVSDDKKMLVGDEYVKDAKVNATIISHGKDRKVLVFKYKAKKNERKMKGHRQAYTKIQIEKITTGEKVKKEKVEKVIEEKA